jgi:hypothetical protein
MPDQPRMVWSCCRIYSGSQKQNIDSLQRHHWEIQIPPYWYAVTHLQVLPFLEDLHGAGNAVIVHPVVAIPAATPVAHFISTAELLPVARGW